MKSKIIDLVFSLGLLAFFIVAIWVYSVNRPSQSMGGSDELRWQAINGATRNNQKNYSYKVQNIQAPPPVRGF